MRRDRKLPYIRSTSIHARETGIHGGHGYPAFATYKSDEATYKTLRHGVKIDIFKCPNCHEVENSEKLMAL